MAMSRSHSPLLHTSAATRPQQPPIQEPTISDIARWMLRCALVLGMSVTTVAGQSFDWAKQTAGGFTHRAYGIATDAAGNSFVTGLLNQDPPLTAVFAPGEPGETTIPGDTFLASYDPNGALRWVRGADGGHASLGGRSVGADSVGNSYMTGSFRFELAFDDGTILPGNEEGLAHMFLAKYDSAGTLLWARRPEGSAIGWGVSVDDGGFSYVTGFFSASVTFAPGVTLTHDPNVSGQGIFVAKYDTTGAAVWARQIRPSSHSGDVSVAVDLDGNVYASGFVQGGDVTFAPGAPDETILVGLSNRMFVARYGPDGSLVWARAIVGDASTVETANIAVDDRISTERGVHIAGSFSGTITLQPGTAEETLLTAVFVDVFLARFDINGSLQWVRHAPGPRVDFAETVAADVDGSSYVAGGFSSFITFGLGEPNETTLTTLGEFDIFVAKYDDSGALSWAKRAGGEGESAAGDTATAMALDSVANALVTGYFTGDATFGFDEPTETALTAGSSQQTEVFIAKYLNGAPSADVMITKTTSPDPITLGDVLTYTIVVTNGGPSIATGVTVSDTLPSSVGFVSVTSSQGSCVDGLTVFCELGALSNGDAATITLLVTPTAAGEVVNTATVLADQLDPSGNNNAATATTTVNPVPSAMLDLDIDQLRVTNRVAAARGGSINIVLAVKNNGTTDGSANATVVGLQNGVQVYAEAISVSDPVGNGRTTVTFPPFIPAVAGDIAWTATIDDEDPDIDVASGLTRVAQ